MEELGNTPDHRQDQASPYPGSGSFGDGFKTLRIAHNWYRIGTDSFENNELAFPSPRSWEMVSNILNSVCGDLNKVYPLVEGCIGTRTAGSFRAWCEIFNKLPPVESAFCDDFASGSVPVRPEAMLAFVSKMVAFASGERTEKEIRNSIEYAAKLPNEIKHKLFDDYLRIKSIQPALKKCRSFAEWMIYNDKDWLYD